MFQALSTLLHEQEDNSVPRTAENSDASHLVKTERTGEREGSPLALVEKFRKQLQLQSVTDVTYGPLTMVSSTSATGVEMPAVGAHNVYSRLNVLTFCYMEDVTIDYVVCNYQSCMGPL